VSSQRTARLVSGTLTRKRPACWTGSAGLAGNWRRRDVTNCQHIGSSGNTMWKTVARPEGDGWGQTRARWLDWVPHSSLQSRSSGPQRREHARKSVLADQSPYAATRELTLSFPVVVGCLAWTRNGGHQDRVVGVVVGIMPHPGDGSTVHKAKDHREGRSRSEGVRRN
jgi:hypothetical protein